MISLAMALNGEHSNIKGHWHIQHFSSKSSLGSVELEKSPPSFPSSLFSFVLALNPCYRDPFLDIHSATTFCQIGA
jgi:hypothetical protein